MKKFLARLFLANLTLALFFNIIPKNAFAVTIPYLITEGIPSSTTTQGATFLNKTFNLNYQSGSIFSSANQDGIGNTVVDDGIEIKVTRPDGTISTATQVYQVGCSFIRALPPRDLTILFKPGINKVEVRMYDICGQFISSGSFYLVNINAPIPTPMPTPTPDPASAPFLELPWNYKSKELSFTEAATAINSFFDHEYPLLSIGLNENVDNPLIVSYLGPPRVDKSYSSHDGYDYGKDAKVINGEFVLAAAAGEAVYINSCAACGNAIHIDHKNGYQTRYYHLQKDGLITNTPGQKADVLKGQAIGKVGATGNVFPAGEAGAHIHFMVVQDKNNDGNFDDNIPDGITDPFGWQSSQPDPWENYLFFYSGQNRIGNKSFYLWKEKLDGLDETLDSNGGVFKVNKFEFSFPQGATGQQLSLEVNSAPVANQSNLVESLGSTINVIIKDALGNLVTQLLQPFSLVVDFSSIDLTRFDLNTLSIYSSQDGINWIKENAILDLLNKKAATQINHLTHFALMAERIDVTSPETEAILSGDKGENNWFRSDVKVSLEATDDILGVDYTLYSLEDGDWETYDASLNFTSEGHYKVEFYSVDNDENIEEFKTVEFDIDKTMPVVSIDAYPKTLWPPDGVLIDVQVIGSSSDSNLLLTKITVDDEYDLIEPEILGFGETIKLEAKRDGGDKDGRVYIIRVETKDLAGNIGSGEARVIVPHDQGN